MFETEKEILKIIDFINNYVEKDETVVIPVSGGLDSDVTARLCCKAVGKDRIKMFIVKEDNLETKFIKNARNLAQDLGVKLIEIELCGKSSEMIRAIAKADTDNIFNPNSTLQVRKNKVFIKNYNYFSLPR